MNPNILLILLLLNFLVSLIQAQPTVNEKLYEVRGIVKTQDKAILAGLNLYFENEAVKKSVVSNEEGAFSIKLPVGRYKITANAATSRNFVAFIYIPEDKPYPTDFELIVEISLSCCAQASDGKPTEVIKYTAPPFPPAALAVRASGEVIVAVKIDREGIVISAQAENGHVLLRKAAEFAAKTWLFSKDENSAEREGKVIIAFAFGNKDSGETEVRFLKPNRLEVIRNW